MDEKTTIDCLAHAVSDAQGTIRAYDVKAEILAALLVFVIGVTNHSFVKHDVCYERLVYLSSLTALTAILMIGMVLFPKKNQFKKIDLGNYSPQGTYFLYGLDVLPQNTVDSFADKAKQTNWIAELTYENMKLTVIRERKDFWFKCALWMSGITIAIVFILILISLFNA